VGTNVNGGKYDEKGRSARAVEVNLWQAAKKRGKEERRWKGKKKRNFNRKQEERTSGKANERSSPRNTSKDMGTKGLHRNIPRLEFETLGTATKRAKNAKL